ncbi:MAG: hypothetical protein LBU65_03595 [Planctomycetaceae bacterium]|nr:hypothetical protein [Planctomycetaceae bacterium]
MVYNEQTYDNIDRVIKSEQFLVQEPSDRLLSRTEQFYDVRDNVWKTEQSVVDPETGTVQGILQGQTWFDDNGRTIKQIGLGARYYTKYVYDSLGRIERVYIGIDDSAANDIDDDIIFT